MQDLPILPSFLFKYLITVAHAFFSGHIDFGLRITVHSLLQHIIYNAASIFSHISERSPDDINCTIGFLEKVVCILQQKRDTSMGDNSYCCPFSNVFFIALGGSIIHSPYTGSLVNFRSYFLFCHLTWVWNNGTEITFQLQRLLERKMGGKNSQSILHETWKQLGSRGSKDLESGYMDSMHE